MNNLLHYGLVGGAGIALAVVGGCGKKSTSPSSEARGASAPEAPAEVDALPPASAEGPTEAVAPTADAEPRGLTRASAEDLLAAIRERGKKATLVNAWASWCGPCRRELPMLQALAANLKPQGVEVVLVSVDEEKDAPKAESYLADNRITLRSYLVSGSLQDFKQGINPRWPGMLPASFLFDRGARLVHFWGGEAFENELTPTIEAFLAGKPIEAETRYGLLPGKVE
jgi:thiol-disulfide isomerase/thioredoxin